jgi:LDH2 family malate/lactate/ureidoglycolate dehydrogenase
MVVVMAEELHPLVARIYEAAGTPPEHARTVADHQVGANLSGHDSHGVHLLPTYVERIDKGHIVPTARPVVLKETPTSLYVNGNWGFGPVVSDWTMERVIAKARDMGLAMASVREQSHIGRLADYPLMASRAGMVGMIMADSGRTAKSVAPFGGREARLGTNPLSIALPSNLPAPVFLDMATSAVAAGKLKVARARGQSIPLGWVLDREGRPTTNPNDFYGGGVMLPMGGAEAHKGYALSFMVETLAAILPGLGFGVYPQGPHNDGVFMLVADPGAFRPAEEFRADVSAFATYLKETPPAEGFEEVFYPGEVEYRTEQKRRREGIPIEEATWQAISQVAERFGLRHLVPAGQ